MAQIVQRGGVIMYHNINAERARRGMTIDELTKAIGVSRRTFHTWQQTGDIPATKLSKMAELFNCSVDYLLDRPGTAAQETSLVEREVKTML